MNLRYPIKPVEIYQDSLDRIDSYKDSYAEQKIDGFRTFIIKDNMRRFLKEPSWYKNGNLLFLSRRDQNKGGPTSFPVSDKIIEAVNTLNLPDNTFLDGEWAERRTKKDNLNECLFIFDILWYNDEWLGPEKCYNRRKRLEKLTYGNLNDYLRMPEMTTTGFKDFYEKQKQISWTEGIVIKEKDSTCQGMRQGCIESGVWQKCKFRGGHNGREIRISQ